MANILRFVILGDDRGGPAFATFTRQVENANTAVDRNNAALGRQSAASKKSAAEVSRLSAAMDGLQKHGGPSWLGPLMLAIPAIGTLGGVAAGAVIGAGRRVHRRGRVPRRVRCHRQTRPDGREEGR